MIVPRKYVKVTKPLEVPIITWEINFQLNIDDLLKKGGFFITEKMLREVLNLLSQ